jgi:hypothetical protein
MKSKKNIRLGARLGRELETAAQKSLVPVEATNRD